MAGTHSQATKNYACVVYGMVWWVNDNDVDRNARYFTSNWKSFGRLKWLPCVFSRSEV